MNQANFSWLRRKEKITMLTAYDFPMAKLVEKAGIDLILVGDSLGMVVLGFKDTKSVTMDDMVRHTAAVARGVEKTPVIGDMPIGSYETGESAVKNATRLIEAGALAVKFEGNKPEVIKALAKAGIPAMGHLGLLPQTAEKYCVQGKEIAEAEKILKDAKELDSLGAIAIVLECVPSKLAKKITESISAPTIGIGAGKFCSGQVLVITDLLGINPSFRPKFVKKYASLAEEIEKAVLEFKQDVLDEKFPAEENSFG